MLFSESLPDTNGAPNAVAHVPDAERCVTTELRAVGNVLVQVGRTGEHFAGSHLDLLSGAHRTPSAAAGTAPQFDPAAPARYRAVHQAMRRGLVQSCHDIAEGGLAVAVAEMCIASRLGVTIDALPHADATAAMFSETAGRLVLEVAPDDLGTVKAMVPDTVVLGTVSTDPVLDFAGLARVDVARLTEAFAGEPL